MKRESFLRRRLLGALLLGAVFALVPAAAGRAEASENTIEVDATGVTFELPEAMQNLEGTIQPGYAGELEVGSGIYITALTYCAVTRDQYLTFAEKGSELTEEDIEFLSPRLVEFLLVYAIDDGRDMEALQTEAGKYGLPCEDLLELGSAGEYSFFAMPGPFDDRLEEDYIFDGDLRAEYDAIVEACREPGWIKVSEPAKTTAEEGGVIAFETTDLDGNTVRSEAIFAGNKLTMVNMWGTFCGPCINEMPDLQELSERLAEKDCGIIGVVIDVDGPEDEAHIGAAKEIMADTGVTYLNLVPWEGVEKVLPAQFVPTTYFIDSNGQIVGEAAVGARGADEYEALLDDVLARLP